MKKNKSGNTTDKSRLHIPQETPVNHRSGDKLRENPANDEETISQDPRKHTDDSNAQSPLTREHDGDRGRVTNADDQTDVVNPTSEDWDEPQEDPKPGRNPNEEIGDNPDETQRKIPKM